MKKLQDCEFDVLNEFNHNHLGNPHPQYVGNNIPSMIMPMEYSTGKYFKLCSFDMDKTGHSQVILAFDVYDYAPNNYLKKWNFVLNVYQREFQTNNGIFKYFCSNEYDRVRLVENQDDNNSNVYHYELWILVNESNPMFAKSLDYVQNNSLIFYDRTPLTDNITDGKTYNNIINVPKFSIEPPPGDGFEYYNIATFDLSAPYNSFGVIFEFNRYFNSTSGDDTKTGYLKFLLYFQNDGENITYKFQILDNTIIRIGDEELFLIQDSTSPSKFYLFIRTLYPMIHEYSLQTMDYTGNSNAIYLNHGGFTKNLPEGTRINGNFQTFSNLSDGSGNNYKLEIENSVFIIKNSSDTPLSNTVIPQPINNSSAADVAGLRNDFNDLLTRLKNAKVLYS